MPDVAIIVPFRPSTRWRDRAAQRVHLHLATVLPDATFRFVDDDPDAPFSRGGSVNAGVEACPADVYVSCDADMLIPAEQIHAAIEWARKPGVVNPFDEYHYLSTEQTKRILDTPGWPKRWKAAWSSTPGSKAVPALGGCNVFSRETWERTGGMLSLRGWGCEDIAWDAMCSTFVAPLRRVPGPGLHLYHPRDAPISSTDPALLERKATMDAVCEHRGDPEAMRSALLRFDHAVPPAR